MMRGPEPGQPDQGPPRSLIPRGRGAPRVSKRMSRQGPASRRNRGSTREERRPGWRLELEPLGSESPCAAAHSWALGSGACPLCASVFSPVDGMKAAVSGQGRGLMQGQSGCKSQSEWPRLRESPRPTAVHSLRIIMG